MHQQQKKLAPVKYVCYASGDVCDAQTLHGKAVSVNAIKY